MTGVIPEVSASGVVEVHGLSHWLRRELALDNLTVSIPQGSCGLLGPNGAGKTTLMRLLSTIYRPQVGQIRVLGYDLGDDNDRQDVRSRIGYLPQAFGVFPGFTVSEFVEYFAILRGVHSSVVVRAVGEALAQVELTARSSSKMKTLSGGMLRRAGLAQAIVHQPALLLLDEPTAGLDPDQRHAIRETLRRIAASNTVVISTHLIEDIAALGGHVLVLRAGRLCFEGTTQELADFGMLSRGEEAGPQTPLERGYSATQEIGNQ